MFLKGTMSLFKVATQRYKGWNWYSSRPSHEQDPTLWRERNWKGGNMRVLEGAGFVAQLLWNTRQVRTSQSQLESKVSCFTNTQPIIKCFEKHLSLMGWGVNSVDTSVTMERDCARTEQCHWARKGMPSGRVMPHTANTHEEASYTPWAAMSVPLWWSCTQGRSSWC